MDYYNSQLKILFESNDGVLSAADLQKAGIDRRRIYSYLEQGILKKESHGNYVLMDEQPDEYRIIQSRSDKIVFSYGTALFLHGMLECVPTSLDITVPQGDNISRIKKDYKQTRFHYCKKEIWDFGIVTIKSPQGYDIRVYDLERCICDLIRDKKSVDAQIYTQALKKYFGTGYNSKKIIKCARQFNLESKVRTYMELLG